MGGPAAMEPTRAAMPPWTLHERQCRLGPYTGGSAALDLQGRQCRLGPDTGGSAAADKKRQTEEVGQRPAHVTEGGGQRPAQN